MTLNNKTIMTIWLLTTYLKNTAKQIAENSSINITIPKNSAPIIINRHDMLIKSNIKKKTECTVFLEAVTIIAETIAIKEKK